MRVNVLDIIQAHAGAALGLAGSILMAGCAEWVSPNLTDVVQQRDRFSSDATPMRDDQQLADAPQTDASVPPTDARADSGMLQPSNRMVLILSTLADLPTQFVELRAVFPGPYLADGLHGSERTQSGCYVRRNVGWRRRDVGHVRIRSPAIDVEIPTPIDLEYVWGQVDYPDRTPERFLVSGSGSPELPAFELASTMPPILSMVTPAGGRDIPRSQLTSTIFRWRPTTFVGEVWFYVRAPQLWIFCRTPSQGGEYQLPSFVADEVSGPGFLALDVGTSEEHSVNLSGTEIVLTTMNRSAAYVYAMP